MPHFDVIPLLQLAIGPVILISGVGLLLLSITNRYGRVIDRARVLSDALRRAAQPGPHLLKQLQILMRRAGLLRTSITFGVIAVLCASVLIIGLFLLSVIHLNPGGFVVLMFTACMLSLILSLAVFLVDINASLSALQLDYRETTGGPAGTTESTRTF